LEILPVFARKPLWGYRVAVAGMLGVTLLSFFVWQHHLFISGINSKLRPFYMLTTELISIPTGIIFLIAMGTIWQGRLRLTVPMLFSLAFFFNFLIGGLSGIFLSDVPSDVTAHGSYFVMAHFHYTIMGGLVFAFFAATYYWLPKMTGVVLNERLAKIHFWMMFVFFNLTFFPLFAAGFLDMPRRVSPYPPHLQTLNDFVSASAIVSYPVAAGTAFSFIACMFAFFYLRALNTNGLWAGGKPGHHVQPSLGAGIAVLVCVLGSVALVRLALFELRARARPIWRWAGGGALLLGLAAVAVQCWQYTDLGFGPGDGGYASVYLGWTGFLSVFVFGAMCWLEAVLPFAR